MAGKAKYAEGKYPQDLMGRGVPYTTFRAALKREEKRNEVEGPAHQAQRRAEALKYGDPDPVASPVVDPASEAKADPMADVEEAPEKPAPSKPADDPAPLEPLPLPSLTIANVLKAVSLATAAPVGVVTVTLRSPVPQYERLRALAYRNRTSVQRLLALAADEFLDRNKA